MGKKDPRVDAYVAEAARFARPILKHLRGLVHKACPDVEETIKWRFPTFLHKGMLCGMAAFKEHCTFGFWKGSLILDRNHKNKTLEDDAMGQFGRIVDVKQLPADSIILGYIKEAMRLNEQGIKVPRKLNPNGARKLTIPVYLTAALKKNKKAAATFEAFSYSHRKEYVEWLTDAKAEDTRKRRLETTLQWLSEGKSRNWKYENC
jgi:uncharacterized protein YdeI (YjbR/CyaY-like superfamily)